MPGELPFFIVGQVVELLPNVVLVKVPNGNVYHLHKDTPGIEFKYLRKGQFVELEVTLALTRVFSATILNLE